MMRRTMTITMELPPHCRPGVLPGKMLDFIDAPAYFGPGGENPELYFSAVSSSLLKAALNVNPIVKTNGLMTAPYYHSRATKIAVVTNGEGYFEIACPHLSSSEFGGSGSSRGRQEGAEDRTSSNTGAVAQATRNATVFSKLDTRDHVIGKDGTKLLMLGLMEFDDGFIKMFEASPLFANFSVAPIVLTATFVLALLRMIAIFIVSLFIILFISKWQDNMIKFQDAHRSEPSGVPITPEQLPGKVLKQRPGYVKGLGLRPSSSIRTTTASSDSDYVRRLEMELEEQNKEIQL
ncbi:hypothetical protein TEA_025727 [Camellia sinensis var. sinensis]|uniref:Cupin type-1 domain-containing protein n=1 Tax=Camellia sinensis var. sinensis TaxID=542762 RepID=A0A4S4DT03_CAMSN|nr:hypothetical protein TEA_025727 [Camellia sinensis var. sinensis]